MGQFAAEGRQGEAGDDVLSRKSAGEELNDERETLCRVVVSGPNGFVIVAKLIEA